VPLSEQVTRQFLLQLAGHGDAAATALGKGDRTAAKSIRIDVLAIGAQVITVDGPRNQAAIASQELAAVIANATVEPTRTWWGGTQDTGNQAALAAEAVKILSARYRAQAGVSGGFAGLNVAAAAAAGDKNPQVIAAEEAYANRLDDELRTATIREKAERVMSLALDGNFGALFGSKLLLPVLLAMLGTAVGIAIVAPLLLAWLIARK
jgi:hypothetical protein